jgi:hypothetical protein
MPFLGGFKDLDEHDDSSLYKKDEPPEIVSGQAMPSKNKLDFMVLGDRLIGGIEVKNTRPWIYPDSPDVIELLKKCCAVDVVPILIARRIHYSTFSVLSPCGVIVHQTFNQRYPKADEPLAALAQDKNLLGYHDIRWATTPTHDWPNSLTPTCPACYTNSASVSNALRICYVRTHGGTWAMKSLPDDLDDDYGANRRTSQNPSHQIGGPNPA